jgi:hypothetical protein
LTALRESKAARAAEGERPNISEPFVRRPVATTLLTIGLALRVRLHSSCCW